MSDRVQLEKQNQYELYIKRNILHYCWSWQGKSEVIGQAISKDRLGTLKKGLRLLATGRMASSGKPHLIFKDFQLIYIIWTGTWEQVGKNLSHGGLGTVGGRMTCAWGAKPPSICAESYLASFTKPKFKDQLL